MPGLVRTLRALCLAAAMGSAGFSVSDAVAQAGDAKAGMALDAMRLLGDVDAQRATAPPSPQASFLAPTPGPALTDDDFSRALQTGASLLKGIAVRDDPAAPGHLDPYFEGTFKRIRHDYLGLDLITYDRGVYAVPQKAAYVGTFTYFAQPTPDLAVIYPKGSFVIVGKKLTPDGNAETGIYIAEQVTSGFALQLVRATPEYLADFERRHAGAAEAFRREQAARARDSGLEFGAVLSLGLGAAMISSADLPGLDKIQLGQAFVSDVLGDGNALLGALASAMEGAAGQGSLYSGGMDFQAPGLDAMLAGLAVQGMSAAAGSSEAMPPTAPTTAAGTGGTVGPGTGENYSFTCPAGDSYSIPISYRNPSCGAAMKNFARVYSCNLIGDFASAQQTCQQACGNTQCAE